MVPYKMDFKKSFAKAKGRAADTKSALKKISCAEQGTATVLNLMISKRNVLKTSYSLSHKLIK